MGLFPINDPADGILKTDTEAMKKIVIMKDWLNSGIRKVVLSADVHEWEKIMDHFDIGHIVVVCDAGLTQLEPGTNTVIGVWPIKKSDQPKCLKRLQVLK